MFRKKEEKAARQSAREQVSGVIVAAGRGLTVV